MSNVTSEEHRLIREVAVLNALPAILRKNIEEMALTSIMLRDIYVRIAKVVLWRVTRDLTEKRRELGKAGIRVYGNKYVCRGNEGKIEVSREEVRAMIAEYIKGLFESAG